MNKFSKKNNKEVIVDALYNEENSIKEKEQIANNNNINLVVVIILSLILSLISGFLGAYLVIKNNNSTTNSGGIITSSLTLNETNSIADAVSKVYDAVGVVEVYDKEQLISTGTGFVYKIDDDKTYLMTNNHVISSGADIKILFPNSNIIDANIVGSDVYSDIAILSVKTNKDIVSVVLGENSKSKVGDTVFTVGSPEGSNYAGTVTKGILSAKDRVVEVALSNSNTSDYYMNVLQTDAAINPGNSGGPLCNTNGEVIGITNMKLVDNTVEGMGFAIPIENALEVAKILEKDGKITRPYVGIEMLDLNNEINLWRAGILIPENINGGVAIYSVVEGSPADKAGLKKGDIIVKLEEKDVDNLADFRYELYKHSPNSEISVTYIRDGKEEKTKIVLGKSE